MSLKVSRAMSKSKEIIDKWSHSIDRLFRRKASRVGYVRSGHAAADASRILRRAVNEAIELDKSDEWIDLLTKLPNLKEQVLVSDGHAWISARLSVVESYNKGGDVVNYLHWKAGASGFDDIMFTPTHWKKGPNSKV